MTDLSPLLRIRDAHVRCAGREILAVDEFSLAEGESVALLGPNGSGKSKMCIRDSTRGVRGGIERLRVPAFKWAGSGYGEGGRVGGQPGGLVHGRRHCIGRHCETE